MLILVKFSKIKVHPDRMSFYGRVGFNILACRKYFYLKLSETENTQWPPLISIFFGKSTTIEPARAALRDSG